MNSETDPDTADLCPPAPRDPRNRPGFDVVFEDDFDGAELDETKWCRFYLPHWSNVEKTRPRFDIADSRLKLRIDADQEQWCPLGDPGVRVSNLQTGHWSGPLGSTHGQHRFKDGFVVCDVVDPQQLYVPQYCRIDLRARAHLDQHTLAALWLIGYENQPHRSGEITVMEVFGKDVRQDGIALGRGVKRITDPVLVDEFRDDRQPIRLGDWHIYSIDWRTDGIDFLLDGKIISRASQSPDYPMQLMLNLYHMGDPDCETDAWFEIDYVRGYRRQTP